MRELIPEEVRAFLREVGTERSLGEGEVLFEEGDQQRSLYLLLAGTLKAYKTLALEREEIVRWIEPGEILGELEFLDGGARLFTAAAVEDSRIVEVGSDAFEEAAGKNVRVALRLFSWISTSLSQSLRKGNELYKRELLRGIEDSGVKSLALDPILEDTHRVSLSLIDGERVRGRIIMVTRTMDAYEIVLLEENGDLVWIPYRSVCCIRSERLD